MSDKYDFEVEGELTKYLEEVAIVEAQTQLGIDITGEDIEDYTVTIKVEVSLF